MSRQLSTDTSTQIITLPSTAGFSVGDYIYATATDFAPLSTFNLGSLSTIFAGSVLSSPAATVGQSAVYGPTALSGTYSGTTLTPGAAYSSAVTLSSPGNYPRIAALLNGNFVVIFGSSTTLSFTIYSSTGSVVSGPTTIDTNWYNSTQTSAVCGTSDGGFAVGYCPNNGGSPPYTTVKKYTSSGSLSWTYNFSSAYNYPSTNWNIACNSSGVIACSYQYSTYYRVMLVSSSGSLITERYFHNDSNSAYGYYGSITAGTSGNFFCMNYGANIGGFCYSVISPSGSTGSVGQTGLGYSNNTTVSPTADGGFISMGGTSGNNIVYSASFNSVGTNTGTSNITVTLPGSQYLYMPSTNNGAFNIGGNTAGTLVLANNGGGYYYPVILIPSTTASYPFTFRTPSGFAGGSGSSSFNTSELSIGPGNIAGVLINGGGSVDFRTFYVGNSTYTNGVTPLTGTITYPTYNFVGVAVSNCSAGSTGQVMTRGVTTVNSNYANVTSPLGFDTTSSGSQFSNKGLIVGRNITLYGA